MIKNAKGAKRSCATTLAGLRSLSGATMIEIGRLVATTSLTRPGQKDAETQTTSTYFYIEDSALSKCHLS